ncbi:MAG: VOC family protein [Myxococcaceae bacterium]|nr:VOC family protein [Myxococcaceae bacterium]
MDAVTPCLWFDGQAEEAVAFYVSLIPGSKVTKVTPGPGGRALTVAFSLGGRDFVALNGGPQFHFTEAMSLVIHCDTQADIDRLWSALTADGGAESRCGWCKDRFGLSWQVVPRRLGELLSDPDRARAQRVVAAFMPMTKLVLADLERAFAGP